MISGEALLRSGQVVALRHHSNEFELHFDFPSLSLEKE